MMKYLVFFVLLLCLPLKAQDPWKIEVSNPDEENYYGVTVANGALGLISSAEPLQNSQIVLAGAYDKYGRGGVSNFFDGISFLNVSLNIDGVSVKSGQISNYRQELDMKHGVFNGFFTVDGKAEVSYSVFALRQLPYCAMMVVDVKPLDDITVSFYNRHSIPDCLRDAQMRDNTVSHKQSPLHLIATDAKSPSGKLSISASSAFVLPEGGHVSIDHFVPDNNRHFNKFTTSLKKGMPYRVGVVGSMLTSAHHPDPKNEADRLAIFAALEGIDRLVSRHEAEWEKLWKGDIEIEGDPQAQQDVRSMLYHMYSFVREGSGYSLSPMGLSGLGYNGHVFWDADTWVYPALLMFHPEMARSLVDYRCNRLEAAKQNAFLHGFKGAMFPWESSDSGMEETPVWALTGPFEHHVTGCVALAAWNYYRVTGDLDWLRSKGFPLLKETADFWASRIEEDETGFHIRNVVCADEWAENVDDNAYTNAVAMVNLQIASKAANLVGAAANPLWKKYETALPILKMDNGVTREHASYNGENIKQADVNLLAYPLNIITNKEQIARDLEYYSQRVPIKGTPAMTQAIFSLLYARLGNRDQALHYFKDAYVPNLCPPFRVVSEFKGGTNPYFITGSGGVLQAIIMGFGGLDITDKGLVQVKSVLPTGWKKLTIKGVGKDKKSYSIESGD